MDILKEVLNILQEIKEIGRTLYLNSSLFKPIQFDEEVFVNLGLKYNQKNKDRKTRKRKIKQLLGLW